MKEVKVASIQRRLYVEVNGNLVEVKQIDSVEGYKSSVTVYTKVAVKGASKGTTLYCVAVEDYIPTTRGSSVVNMLASGKSADEVLALEVERLTKIAQARIAKAQAK